MKTNYKNKTHTQRMGVKPGKPVLNRWIESILQFKKIIICIITASRYSTYFSQEKSQFQSKTPQPSPSNVWECLKTTKKVL